MANENFVGKFPINGVRYLDAYGKAIESGRDFRIVLPAAKNALPELTGNKASSKFSSTNFMLCVGQFEFDKYRARLYEEDIVDYSTVNIEHSVGVVMYDQDMYMYVVKDAHSETVTPLFDVKLHSLLGNIYNDESFLTMSSIQIYEHLHIPAPFSPKTTATPAAAENDAIEQIKSVIKPKTEADAIDVYLDLHCRENKTASWGYKLACGDKIKKQAGEFKASGKDDGYYMAAGILIALENIKSSSRNVNLVTSSDFIVKMINDKLLDTWAKNNWKKNDGTSLKNVELLQKIKQKLDDIGPIKAYKVDNLGLAS